MRRLLLVAALGLLALPAQAQVVTFRTPDNLSNTPVSARTPLPTRSVTNVTADISGLGSSTSCSGTITTAGTAQTFLPVTSNLRGYYIQNQSASPLYVRSKGAAGTLNATADQNSFRIDAGATWAPPVASDYGYSIIGGTAGQAFHCLYW